MIDVACGFCETQFRLDDAWGGKRARCPKCQSVVSIPAAALTTTGIEAKQRADRREGTRGNQGNEGKRAAVKSAAIASVAPPAEPLAPPSLHLSESSADISAPPVTSPPVSSSPLPKNWKTRLADRRLQLAAGGALVLLVVVGVVVAMNSGTPESVPVAMQDPSRPTGGLDEVEEPEANPSAASPAAKPVVEPVNVPAEAAPEKPPSEIASDLPVTPEMERVAVPTKPAPRKKPASGPQGLSGLSSDYSDFHCCRIQFAHGVTIPHAATIIEVDGWRLPIDDVPQLFESPAPVLFLPRGQHAVRFRVGDRPITVEIRDDFTATYEAARNFFDLNGKVQKAALIERGGRATDVHGAPLLLNFQGAGYAQDGQWSAAERKFRRAIRVNPTFSPAHLNLAHCLVELGRPEEAAREWTLAAAFNVGNVFGLEAAIHAFRERLGDTPTPPLPLAFSARVYVSPEPRSVEDERIASILQAISKYAVKDEERAKLRNNLAVHFSESGRPQLALEHFRGALAALKTAGPERFEIATKILGHMSDTCRYAGYEEADEYAAMQQFVLP